MSDGFHVKVPDLQGFASLVERGHEAFPDKSKDRLLEPLVRGSADSFQNMMQIPIEVYRKQAIGGITDAERYLATSADNLHKAATCYKDNDHAFEEKLDRTYPREGSYLVGNQLVHIRHYRPSDVPEPDTAAKFNDVARPERWNSKSLDPSDSVDPNAQLRDKVKDVENLSTSLSPTSAIRTALDTVFGFDVFDRVLRFVDGDWDPIGRISKAMTYGGKAIEEIAANLQRGLYGVQQTWHGNAASCMQTDFQQFLYRGLQEHGAFCRAAGQRIMDFARATFANLCVIEYLLQTILDIFTMGILKASRTLKSIIEVVETAFFGALRGKVNDAVGKMDEIQVMIDMIQDFTSMAQGLYPVPDPGTFPEVNYTFRDHL